MKRLQCGQSMLDFGGERHAKGASLAYLARQSHSAAERIGHYS